MLKTIQWFAWVRNLYSSLLIYDRDLKSMVSGMTLTNIFALALPQYSFLLNRLPDGDMLTLRRDEPGRIGRKKFNGFLMISIQYPDAKKVVPVMDNLNTHTISSLYDTLPNKQINQASYDTET
jgi:hypothetical protein